MMLYARKKHTGDGTARHVLVFGFEVAFCGLKGFTSSADNRKRHHHIIPLNVFAPLS